MTSSYPSALDNLATDKTDATVAATDHKNHHNDLADAVNKIEAELGTDPSGTGYATVKARLAPVTKRITLSIAGEGGTGNFNGFTDYAQRLMVALPVVPTRWRLRIRNSKVIPATANTGVLTCTAVYFGTPSYPTGGAWAGAMTATPTQVLPAFNTDSAGAEYTSGWVTDGGTYFSAPGLPKILSLGWTTTGTGINIANSSLGGYSYWDTGASAAAGNATAAGSSSRSNAFLDIRLEYEYDDIYNRPTIWAVGDSITAGYEGSPEGSGVAPHESWIGAACMRKGIPWINSGVSGSSTGNWTSAGTWAYTRSDLATTVPDAAVIALGFNDADAAIATATYQANIGTIVANIRALGVNKIYICTVIPGSLVGGDETARVAYNNWIKTIPWGATGIFDHAKAIETPGTAVDPDPDYVTTPPHPEKRGYARMASVTPLG